MLNINLNEKMKLCDDEIFDLENQELGINTRYTKRLKSVKNVRKCKKIKEQ